MTDRAARLALILLGTVWACHVAFFGIEFSLAVEPEAFNTFSAVYWLVVGFIVASPLWIPALVPAQYPRTLGLAAIVGAAGTIGLVVVSGSIVFKQTVRLASGYSFHWPALFHGLVLLAACILGLVLIRRLLRARRLPTLA